MSQAQSVTGKHITCLKSNIQVIVCSPRRALNISTHASLVVAVQILSLPLGAKYCPNITHTHEEAIPPRVHHLKDPMRRIPDLGDQSGPAPWQVLELLLPSSFTDNHGFSWLSRDGLSLALHGSWKGTLLLL